MDDGVALADTRAAVDALAGDPRCDGRVSVIGFCLGGKYALQCAAAGGIDASVSFYPVRVQDYQQQLLGLKCPTQVHVGDADPHIPPEVAQLLSDALSASPAHELHVYPGAGHGFFNPVRSFGYAPEAAAVALARSTRFLKHQRAA
jgi:carboxymethylenebutenolidase